MYTFTERGIWVEQIIDLKEVGRVLIKKRRKIINITVACMVLGGAYAFLAPSTYQSTSMLRIKQAQGLSNSVLSSANAYSDSMSRQLMNTDAEILKSRNVVEPVITAIEDPEGTGNAPTYEDFVKTRIETKPYKETELLQVSVTGNSPEQAQEANQLLIDTFLKRLAEISHVEQRTTREFLQKRVVTAKSELEQAENKYDLETAARLRHGTLPRLEKELEELKSKESKDNITKIIDVKRTNGNSLDNIDFSTNKGFIIPDAPITINKLNILEPITLPIAIPF